MFAVLSTPCIFCLLGVVGELLPNIKPHGNTPDSQNKQNLAVFSSSDMQLQIFLPASKVLLSWYDFIRLDWKGTPFTVSDCLCMIYGNTDFGNFFIMVVVKQIFLPNQLCYDYFQLNWSSWYHCWLAATRPWAGIPGGGLSESSISPSVSGLFSSFLQLSKNMTVLLNGFSELPLGKIEKAYRTLKVHS